MACHTWHILCFTVDLHYSNNLGPLTYHSNTSNQKQTKKSLIFPDRKHFHFQDQKSEANKFSKFLEHFDIEQVATYSNQS